MARKVAITVTRQQNGFDDFGFTSAFERAGYEVINFDDRTFLWYHADTLYEKAVRRALRNRQIAAFNSELRRYLEMCRPEIFFVFKGCAVDGSTIDFARTAGTKTIFCYPDLEPAVHRRNYLDALKRADLFFHTKPNLLEHMRLSVRSDAKFVYPLYDEAFVEKPIWTDGGAKLLVAAHHSPGKAELVERIARAGVIDIEIFGAGWSPGLNNRVTYGGPLFGPPIRSKLRSATAVLGLLTERLAGFTSGDKITARSIHVPAYGGLLLHQFTDEAVHLYDGNECLFTDENDLIAKLGLLAESPDQRLDLALRQHHSVLSKAFSQDEFIGIIEGL